MLFAREKKAIQIISFIFFFCSLAKRYLLTDSIVKLKEFQQKKVAIAYNLPGTKGNSMRFINSFIHLSFKLPLSLVFQDLSYREKKKSEQSLSFLVYLSSHTLLLKVYNSSFSPAHPQDPREIVQLAPWPVISICATQNVIWGPASIGRSMEMRMERQQRICIHCMVQDPGDWLSNVD